MFLKTSLKCCVISGISIKFHLFTMHILEQGSLPERLEIRLYNQEYMLSFSRRVLLLALRDVCAQGTTPKAKYSIRDYNRGRVVL